MNCFRSLLLMVVLSITGSIRAQQYPFDSNQTMIRLKQHVSFFADDKLEGRLVGSKGEQLALRYIVKEFKRSGLRPATPFKDFSQAFSFKRLTYTPSTSFSYETMVSSKKVTMKIPVGETFYPFHFSGMGAIKAGVVNVGYGITTEDGSYDDYKNVPGIKGKIALIKVGYPQKESKVFARFADLEARADSAVRRGAVGIIFHGEHLGDEVPAFKRYFTYTSFHGRKDVPIVFWGQPINGFEKGELLLTVDTVTRMFEGHNVIGFMNNHAVNTVVIGAHYDHLGYNELGGSTNVSTSGKEQLIHNGADDNASGTAALMELARSLSQSDYKHYNYLFVAFSGEEEGLLGSNYLVNHMPIEKQSIHYMINMDMVGRLDTAKQTFAISGTGTSPSWEKVLDATMVDGLKAKYTQSGTGASDHTSFYVNGIPVLHYFTGSHSDYHKPTDDEGLINYQGMYSIVKQIYRVVGVLDTFPKLAFTQTKEDTAAKTTFKVTLGIMPDYLYEGKGVKIDGVTPGRPAAVAGLQRGDQVIQMGDIVIEDMSGYMKALGKFSKGQTTKVKVKRGEAELLLDVTF